jgi:hypothetical protein
MALEEDLVLAIASVDNSLPSVLFEGYLSWLFNVCELNFKGQIFSS